MCVYIYIYIYIYVFEHSLRCSVEKSLRTTNKTIFPAHINLLFVSACQNALCSADDTTKAEMPAVWRLSTVLSVLDLVAVQIEHSTWQHHTALQLCIAHCLAV